MAKQLDDTEIQESGLTEREEKQLPQWAQERLAKLRGSLDSEKKTGISYGDIHGPSPKFLKDGPFDPIRFTIDDKAVDLFRKTVGEHEYVLVNSSSSLTIIPLSTNSAAFVPQGLDAEIFRSTD